MATPFSNLKQGYKATVEGQLAKIQSDEYVPVQPTTAAFRKFPEFPSEYRDPFAITGLDVNYTSEFFPEIRWELISGKPEDKDDPCSIASTRVKPQVKNFSRPVGTKAQASTTSGGPSGFHHVSKLPIRRNKASGSSSSSASSPLSPFAPGPSAGLDQAAEVLIFSGSQPATNAPKADPFHNHEGRDFRTCLAIKTKLLTLFRLSRILTLHIPHQNAHEAILRL
ncbi:hypothetical protein MKZ38_010232 [Zalerion maritima]|uniref:Uncharacterized protein n=1 Tax=Zalerion maritima TaxID=339359 RepID=A0AAD5RTN2_9PEZI|nr:hypothetical protein MKZ38_010232 [Zalerion maritima]